MAQTQVRWLKALGDTGRTFEVPFIFSYPSFLYIFIPGFFPVYFYSQLILLFTNFIYIFIPSFFIKIRGSGGWRLSGIYHQMPLWMRKVPFPTIPLFLPACPSFLVTTATWEQSWQSSKTGPISWRDTPGRRWRTPRSTPKEEADQHQASSRGTIHAGQGALPASNKSEAFWKKNKWVGSF